jgi:hypothetical protein
MAEEKIVNLSVATQPAQPELPVRRRQRNPSAVTQPTGEAGSIAGAKDAAGGQVVAPPAPPPWHQFLRTADNRSVSQRFAEEANNLLTDLASEVEGYCFLALLDSETYITDFDLDRIFSGLMRMNSARDKNVLLFLLTRGGSIEPAYQMSKLCKSFARERFVVVVPRQAKSAGTLLAIGADEIHMGPLGQLGPIDPQLGGLPALGVSQALKSIAAVAEQYPKSSEMFSKYLKLALTVEQIGYCERVSESAAQYAERLLKTKDALPQLPKAIANELVHEYKDHGFVIDLDEARQHLGSNWVKTETPEAQTAERLYNLFEEVNIFLNVYQHKRLLVIGTFAATDVLVFDRQRR